MVDDNFIVDDGSASEKRSDDDLGIPVYEPESDATEGSDDSADNTTAGSFVYGEPDTPPTTTDEPIAVGVADYAVSTDRRSLETSGLGSCIAVAVHDTAADVSGLLHFMLPRAAESNGQNHAAGKFADTGLEELFTEFIDSGGDPERSTARIVGGASMVQFTQSEYAIGERNVMAARSALQEYGVTIVGEETGGDTGRSVEFDPQAGELVIKRADGTETVL